MINTYSSTVEVLLQTVCKGGSKLVAGNPEFLRLVEETLSPKESVADPLIFGLRRESEDVAVPVSGGLDSTVVYFRALENRGRRPVTAYYYDMGQSYILKEKNALIELGILHNTVKGPTLSPRWEHIIPGRNLYILLHMAEQMIEGGRIMFGAVEGEIVEKGGDKSVLFFKWLNELLQHLPNPVRVELPLANETKVDMVRWWLDSKLPTYMLEKTVSCFDAKAGHCGRCLACLRKAIAFACNGLQLETEVPVKLGCAKHINRLQQQMQNALVDDDYSVFTRKRCVQDLQGMSILLEEK